MKKLTTKVIKSEKQFLRNYKLHDLAEIEGKKILSKLGYKTEGYGEDRRYEDVWEAGEDKPDCKIIFNNHEICLLDWKGKKSDWVGINERAYKSYIKISEKINKKVVIAIAKFDKQSKHLVSFKYFVLPNKSLVTHVKQAWDGNNFACFDRNQAKDFEDINLFFKTLIG